MHHHPLARPFLVDPARLGPPPSTLAVLVRLAALSAAALYTAKTRSWAGGIAGAKVIRMLSGGDLCIHKSETTTPRAIAKIGASGSGRHD